MTRPVVRRPGGNGRSLARLRPLVPPHIEHFVSPFVGGGALEFDLLGRMPELRGRTVLADADVELIACYRGVQHDAEGVCRALAEQAWTREAFERARDMPGAEIDGLSLAERAARYVAVNRMSFNGLARQNRRGEANQAFSSFDARRVPALCQRVRQLGKVLEGVELVASDFQPIVEKAGPGSFVFADGPYDGTFTGYVAGGFGEADQERLAKSLRALDGRGGRFLATNADTPSIRAHYAGFVIESMPVRYSIAGRGAARRAAGELMIRNYEPDVARLFSMPEGQRVNMTGEKTDGRGEVDQKMSQRTGRLSDANVRTRTQFVQELVKGGVGRKQIVKSFREKFGDTNARVIDRYLRRAREGFMVDAIATPNGIAEARTVEQESFLAKLDKDVELARQAGTWSAIASLRRLEAEVRGLRQLRPAEAANPAPSTFTQNNYTLTLTDAERAHRTGLLERVLERRRQESAVDADGAPVEADEKIN